MAAYVSINEEGLSKQKNLFLNLAEYANITAYYLCWSGNRRSLLKNNMDIFVLHLFRFFIAVLVRRFRLKSVKKVQDTAVRCLKEWAAV